MTPDHNPDKAKMLALLALLDVLDGKAEMAGIGTDRVGSNDGNRGGQLRVRFTVFGQEGRLLQLAHELTLIGSHEGMLRNLAQRIDRDEKLRFAARMIETWSEVMQRLLAVPVETKLAGEYLVINPAHDDAIPEMPSEHTRRMLGARGHKLPTDKDKP